MCGIMSDSLVSVVVPCYNQGEYLHECIESILASTYKNLEIIVVNDGSTDFKSREILKNLNYEKTIVVNQNNQGLSAARNAGISRANGKYILPVDADDMIMPTFIEKAVKVLDSDKRIGIVGGLTEFFGDISGIYDLPKYKKSAILRYNCLVCSCLFRRDDWLKVGGYNVNMRLGSEDWDFWLSLIELGRKVYQFDEVLFKYRKHGITMLGSMTDEQKKLMTLQAIDNHPRLYRRHKNMRYFHETGKHSSRRKILDAFLKVVCLFVPFRRYRHKIRSLAYNVY